MNRRKFLLTSIAGIGLIGTAGWMAIPIQNKVLTINAVLTKLTSLDLNNISFDSAWSAAQIFDHMAQSIEYSMTGYPEHKSDLFKATVGATAFSAFATKGRMIHNLEEAIPGAPALLSNDLNQAFQRLINALNDFTQFSQPLKPHFAFGELSHQEYEQAHVMHIYNHLEKLRTVKS